MPSAGDVLADKYRLIGPLGDPAKGTVWKAEHTTLQTPVAVKFVQRARGEVATKRFLAEAKAAGAVRHQNVVGIIDFGATDEGDPYMVLEHLGGETLRARLDRDPPLSAAEVVHVAVHALSGLAAVHDSDVVHRDLRPENVFLVEESDGRVAKLLDFGVSKSLAAEGSPTLTMEGDVLGSPHYVSPEQLRGDHDLDARADLYSAGVILYEALAGHRPYPGATFREVVRRRAEDAPPLAAVRQELAPLSAVIARAMARERGERFEDARAMRQALLEASEEVSSEAMRAPGPARGSLASAPPRPEAGRPAEAPARSSRAGAIVGLAVALHVVVAVIVQLAVPGGWPVLLGLEPSPEDPGVSGAITPADGGTIVELAPGEPVPPRERDRRRRRSPRPR